jgi:F1F0 ATPase subunit 2
MLVGVAMDAQAMTGFSGMGHDVLKLVLDASSWLAVGAVIGAFHFLTLLRGAQMLAGGSPVLLALALQLIRLAILAGALGMITRHYGAAALLAATLGVLASRAAVLRLGARS